MTIVRTLLVTTAAILAIGYGAAEAGQLRGVTKGNPPATFGKLVGSGPVRDTCDQTYPGMPDACDIDQLTQRCDDAGGGMSSLEGGGVDCDLGPE